MNFKKEGFLSADTGAFVEDHHSRFAELFLLASDLNKFAHEKKADIRVNGTDAQHVICFCLYIRILNSYSAAIRLAELGLCHDAEVVCRTAIEALFYLKSCADDRKFTEDFIKSDQADRLKFLNVAIDSNSELNELFKQDRDNISALHTRLKKEVDGEKIRERKAFEAAKKAGLSGMYDYVYRILSQSTHSSPRSLKRYVSFDSNDKVQELYVGP
jgi:hypothetical protein